MDNEGLIKKEKKILQHSLLLHRLNPMQIVKDYERIKIPLKAIKVSSLEI